MALPPKAPVLAVEDDPVIQRAIARSLKGVDVVFASTGGQALAALSDHVRPAFVLLDFMLPDMDGQELLVRLRKAERTATMPIVMFSS
ncbi:MAG: response regulator, partial [Halobacteriales archaeon]|nr:response regulator [Halobacteriales archaeon]